MREGIRRVFHQYFFQCSLPAKTATPRPYILVSSRNVVGIQTQLGNARMYYFVVASSRHQSNVAQHLPHRQTLSHCQPEFLIGTLAFAGSRHHEIPETKNAARRQRFFIFGAGDEVRTRDLDLGKVALYQLSYSRGRFIATFVALNGSTKVRRFFRQASDGRVIFRFWGLFASFSGRKITIWLMSASTRSASLGLRWELEYSGRGAGATRGYAPGRGLTARTYSAARWGAGRWPRPW